MQDDFIAYHGYISAVQNTRQLYICTYTHTQIIIIKIIMPIPNSVQLMESAPKTKIEHVLCQKIQKPSENSMSFLKQLSNKLKSGKEILAGHAALELFDQNTPYI